MSNLRKFTEFLALAFLAYILLGLAIAFIGEFTIREVLCHPAQMGGLMFIYWIPGLCRMIDVEKN